MTIIIRKVDYLDGNLAASIASIHGANFKTIDRKFVKEFKQMDVIKVVLKTKNAWGKTIQQTYYCVESY